MRVAATVLQYDSERVDEEVKRFYIMYIVHSVYVCVCCTCCVCMAAYDLVHTHAWCLFLSAGSVAMCARM